MIQSDSNQNWKIMVKNLNLQAAIVAVLFLSGCAHTNVLINNDESKIYSGEGGRCLNLWPAKDGVEYWLAGVPKEKKYQIIATVSQSYLDNESPAAMMAYSNALDQLLRAAKKLKADAVICDSSDKSITGISGSINESGQFNVRIQSKRFERYFLIRYIK